MRRAWLLIALAVVPVLPGLADELQDTDPPQYAHVAARILKSGEWLALSDMNGPFLNKPPLMMWAQAVSMAVFGVDSFGARLPVFLFGLLAVLATFLIGRELGGTRLGVLGAAFFGSSVAFHLMVADPKVDMPLTALSALAIAAGLAARRRPGWIWAAWGATGLAVLAKGPIGLVIPVLALGPEALRRGWSGSSSLARRLFALKPLRGALIVAALSAPFYWAAAKQGGAGAIGFHLWKQGLGRLTGDSVWANNTTPLFFTHTMLWALLPFSPLLVATLVKRALGLWRERALPARPARVLVWWFVLPFLVISLARYRLPQYVFCLGPPAALLAAEEALALTDLAAKRWRAIFLGISAAGAALGIGVLIASFPAPLVTTLAWSATLLGLPVAIFAFARPLDSGLRTGAAVVGALVPFLLFFQAFVHPALLEYQPGREIGVLVREKDPTGTVLPFFYVDPTWSIAFYAQRDAYPIEPWEIRNLVNAGATHLAVVGHGGREVLQESGLVVDVIAAFQTYPTSISRAQFLLASTREQALHTIWLVSVRAP